MKISPIIRALSCLVLVAGCAVACSSDEEPATEHAHDVEPTSASDSDREKAPSEETEADRSPFEAHPPEHTFEAGSGGATVHRDAATIVAGDMRLEVRPRSLKAPKEVQIHTRTPSDFDMELPAGLLLGAGSGSPRDGGFLPVARWHIPLIYQMEAGTMLEVLSWHPHLKTWLNLGDAAVTSSGTHALFFTMVMGDVVLRKKPVKALETDSDLCPGENFERRDEWPEKEKNAVGLSTEEDRISREDAFRYMTDYRLGNGLGQCVFKNEETLGLWHKNAVAGESYVDEDYLMDPNAAAALELLEFLVTQEWIDPYTGEPAIQIRVTEAYDSLVEHSSTSSHYHGRALDLTFSPVPPPGSKPRYEYYGRLAKLAVCAGFDYVLFEDNFHVHATVLSSNVAALVQDDDGQYGVLSGDLVNPSEWTLHPHRWDAAEFDAKTIAWGGWNTLEVRNATGKALVLQRGRTGVEEREADTQPPIRRTQVGTQELRVTADQLYLVNTDGRPTIGSGDDTHAAVAVPTPVQFPLSDWRVIDASFRPHNKTQKAARRLENALDQYMDAADDPRAWRAQ